MLTPLVLFGMTPSRLEHYSLPALPAMALLAAGPVLDLARGTRSTAHLVAAAVAGAALVAGAGLIVTGPSLLAFVPWIADAPDLASLPRATGAVLLGGGLVTSAALLAGRGGVAFGTFVATTVAFDAVVVTSLASVTPLLSWRPVAAVIAERVDRRAEVVFEAPVEYQLVGGLDFYLERDVTLLEPAAGFVPPTYLEAYVEGMFVGREEFERRWRGERPVVLVSDPTRRRDTPEGVVPPPFVVLARFGDRWVLGNQTAAR
jgi:putative intracellular protease/amidase